MWADGTHYDYYDSQAQIENAVANVTRFFHTHLAEEAAAWHPPGCQSDHQRQ